MRNGRFREMVFSALAALALTVGLTHSDIAAAGNISTVVALIHATRPIVDAAPASPIPRDEPSLATNVTPRFQTRITWQSGFNLAGSRVWTKVIKFSSNGINIRLPLN